MDRDPFSGRSFYDRGGFTLNSLTATIVFCAIPVLAQDQIQNITVTSGASFKTGLPAGGSIGTIFCTGLRVDAVVTAGALPLPTSLAGITVTIAGVSAPLFAVADLHGYQQINFQVPLETQLSFGTADVVVFQNGNRGSTIATHDDSTPGEIFTLNGTKFGVFQHGSDYSLVTEENPAKAGETVIAYATGLPTAAPLVPTGQPALGSPLSVVRQRSDSRLKELLGIVLNGSISLFDAVDPASTSVDTTGESPIPFIGLAPGSVGLYQINFILPQNVPSGNLKVELQRENCFIAPALGCDPPQLPLFHLSQPVLLPVSLLHRPLIPSVDVHFTIMGASL